VRLETREANIEGLGRVAQRDLVINALRMRPDRIMVGEVRGAEALDMLQAMNTGHDGSMTTIHANSPRDCFHRIETMVLMADMGLTEPVIRQQAASAIQLVIQMARFRDGSRIVSHVAEVVEINQEGVVLEDIFRFQHTGLDEARKVLGKFVATGYRPQFLKRLQARGIHLPDRLFEQGAEFNRRVI
jgi:pilus assembly protein CpaF